MEKQFLRSKLQIKNNIFIIKTKIIVVLLIAITALLFALMCSLLGKRPKRYDMLMGGNISTEIRPITTQQWLTSFDYAIDILYQHVNRYVPISFLDEWILDQVLSTKYTWEDNSLLRNCLKRYHLLAYEKNIPILAKRLFGFFEHLPNYGAIKPPPTLLHPLDKKFKNYDKKDVERMLAVFYAFFKYTRKMIQIQHPIEDFIKTYKGFKPTLEEYATPLTNQLNRFRSLFPSIDTQFGGVEGPIKEDYISIPKYEISSKELINTGMNIKIYKKEDGKKEINIKCIIKP